MKLRANILHFVLLAAVVGGLGAGLTFWLWPEATNTDTMKSQDLTYQGVDYETVCVDPARSDIRLYWRDASGKPYGDFGSLRQDLEAHNLQLDFACNAGIFSEALRPGGLHIEDGKTIIPLNMKPGKGNFHLKPNGVFLVQEGKARVMVSDSFERQQPPAEYATQSGPMLVMEDVLHPEFQAGSENRYIRNGVGVDREGKVWFVLSKDPVNFYDFAILFRDQLHCPNALYLDGSISAFYAPQLDRYDAVGGFCGMLTVVSPLPSKP